MHNHAVTTSVDDNAQQHNDNTWQHGEWCGGSQGGEGMTVGVEYDDDDDDDDDETDHTHPHTFPPSLPFPQPLNIIVPSSARLC